jgi:hypothetical protein
MTGCREKDKMEDGSRKQEIPDVHIADNRLRSQGTRRRVKTRWKRGDGRKLSKLGREKKSLTIIF